MMNYLTPEELLTMTCSPGHRHETIFTRCENVPPEPSKWRVQTCAEHIIKDWNCDFRRLGLNDPFFLMCVDMYENWDDDLCDPIFIQKEHPEDKGYLITNGHHRSLTRACLILTGQVAPAPNCLKYEVATESRSTLKQIPFSDFIQSHATQLESLGLNTIADIAEYMLKIKDFRLLTSLHPFFGKILQKLQRDYLSPQDRHFARKANLLYTQSFKIKVVDDKHSIEKHFIESDKDVVRAVIVTLANLLYGNDANLLYSDDVVLVAVRLEK